tara:strand:+ start:9177 stop:9674 length:498 start_codon:yes stop_codon:yes gene_type:complete
VKVTVNGGQPPNTDPHSLLKGLIEDNTPVTNGWTPVVNTEWIEAKKQKTYQIAITQEYGEVGTAHLDDGTDAIPRIVSQFFLITLFHPTRTGVWTLYRAITKVFNDRSLTTNGVNGNTDYRWVRLARSDEAKAFNSVDVSRGFDRNAGDCMGFRMDLSVELRWHE